MKAALTQPRLISIALIGCLLALFPPPASSQGQVWISHGPEMMDDVMGGGPDFPLFLHSANLTPEQRAQVQKILD
ncbi:MAG TPA: hypothetical protein VMF50_09150, partial [Candidatus Binataceae bacterium]|nr:hypothetical protein [Candidatus Binataceae bacterium]